MRYSLILLVATMIPFTLAAQDSLTVKKQKSVLKLAAGPQPEGYMPPTILPAMEWRRGDRSMQLQIGAMIPWKYTIQDTIDYLVLDGHSYWLTIRGEIRKYKTLHPTLVFKDKREAYIGVEIFANLLRTPRKDEYSVNLNGEDIVYEDALVLNKKMFGGGIVLGMQRYFGSKMFLGVHTGLGIKFKYTVARHNEYNEAKSTYRHAMFMHLADQTGFSVGLAMPINFYVGYSL